MRTWKPQASLGLWVALLLLLLSLAGVIMLGIDLGRVLRLPPAQWPIDMALYGRFVGFVLLVVLSGLLVYRVLGALTLAYQLDRNGLYIQWVGNRAVVPLSQIVSVDSGAQGVRVPLGPLRNIGYYWGRGSTPAGMVVHLFNTAPLPRSLVVYTESAAYVISPADQDGFVQDLEQRRRLGVIKSLSPTIEPGRIVFYAFWHDNLIRVALLVAFALNLLLFGLLAGQYGALADLIEMRFDAGGLPTELRPRHQILFLPLAACAVGLLNVLVGLLLYRRDTIGAQALQMGSVLVQVLFGVAIVNILLHAGAWPL